MATGAFSMAQFPGRRKPFMCPAQAAHEAIFSGLAPPDCK
jgi:hypothetical protein